MAAAQTAEWDRLAALSDDEVVTHSYVRDVPLPSGGVLALITLDNGKDHNRPNTLGPVTLLELGKVLDEQTARAKAKEIRGVAITGKPFIFAAGADLSKVSDIPDRETGKQMAQLGHHVLGKLATLGVPSFVFVNGLALGGGLEIPLNADYRTVDASAAGLALPEVFLGIIPGWGGAWLLPNLIGIENALKVVIENPLKQNRMLKPAEAFELGIVDAIFEPANFLEDSIRWADGVISGKTKVKRKHEPGKLERAVKWDVALGIARKTLESRIGKVAKSPVRRAGPVEAGQERARKRRASSWRTTFSPTSSPVTSSAPASTPSTSCSIAPASLRAHRTRRSPSRSPRSASSVPGSWRASSRCCSCAACRCLWSSPTSIRVASTRAWRGSSTRSTNCCGKGRINPDEANRLKALVRGTTDKADFADCDWVIEAIFEELDAKQKVFAEIEQHITPEAILATNTSSLSVEQIGAKLKHPERVVGFHFFNPVAVMPLIEVVRTSKTTDEALATAMATAEKLQARTPSSRRTPRGSSSTASSPSCWARRCTRWTPALRSRSSSARSRRSGCR